MFIGQLKVSRNGRSYTYHRLLESVRTDKGPRQRLVLSLGTLELPKSEWPRLAERIWQCENEDPDAVNAT